MTQAMRWYQGHESVARSFLDLEATLRTPFLHPGGLGATAAMLNALQITPEMRVLEIGCGTGATLALVAYATGATVIGIDQSTLMLHAARARLAQFRLAHLTHLIQADASRGLPHTSASLDVVYAESVLALLDPAIVLPEIARVLRPGGQLFINDRIWKPGLGQILVNDVNAYSRSAFGIPAATARPLDRDSWLALLRTSGFTQLTSQPLQSFVGSASNHAFPLPPGWPRYLRRTRRHVRHPRTILATLRFQRRAQTAAFYWTLLEDYVFSASTPVGDDLLYAMPQNCSVILL